MIGIVDHITINVVSMDESIYFYGEVLGLERLPDIQMKDHRLVYFKVGDTRIELISYDFQTKQDENELLNMGKFRHMALGTDNIELVYRKLLEHQIQILQPPVWNDRLQFTGMLILDPNGCEIEFVER